MKETRIAISHREGLAHRGSAATLLCQLAHNGQPFQEFGKTPCMFSLSYCSCTANQNFHVHFAHIVVLCGREMPLYAADGSRPYRLSSLRSYYNSRGLRSDMGPRGVPFLLYLPACSCTVPDPLRPCHALQGYVSYALRRIFPPPGADRSSTQVAGRSPGRRYHRGVQHMHCSRPGGKGPLLSVDMPVFFYYGCNQVIVTTLYFCTKIGHLSTLWWQHHQDAIWSYSNRPPQD